MAPPLSPGGNLVTDDLQLDDEELVASQFRDRTMDETRRHLRWILIVMLVGIGARSRGWRRVLPGFDQAQIGRRDIDNA